MSEVVTELKGDIVYVRLTQNGESVPGYEFKVESFNKKEWESRRRFCLKEARLRNNQVKRRGG